MNWKRILRITLGCLLIFLVFALIWWGGPELRLGDTRPLEPAAWRLGLIGLILLLCTVPLILQAFNRLHDWLRTAPQEPVVDEQLNACRAFLHEIKGQRRLKLRRFSPDYLIVGATETSERLLADWPAPIDWQRAHPGAGSAFMSQGRVYLMPDPSAWTRWAQLLRWRPALRGVLNAWEAHTWSDPSARSQATELLHQQGAQWTRTNGRVLPVWILITAAPSSQQAIDWTPLQARAPWGLSLHKGPFSEANWHQASSQWLRTIDQSLSDPVAPPAQIQHWITLRMACEGCLSDAPEVLKRLVGTTWQKNLSVRGVFFAWHQGLGMTGLSGLLSVLHTDRATAHWRPRWALPQLAALILGTLMVLFMTLDASWGRLSRHASVQQEWSTQLPHMQSLQMLGSTASADPSQWLLALNALDILVEDSRYQLGETLPKPAQALIERLHVVTIQQGLNRHLQQLVQARHARTDASPDERYQYLAFLMMLHAPEHANSDLMRTVLSELGLPPGQAEALMDHLGRPRAQPLSAADLPDVALWRAQLLEQDQYSLERRLWRALNLQPRAPDAHDFTLDRYMGPSSAWFSASDEVPWLFTYEGLQRGFLGARSHYPAWASEYQWVMAGAQNDFSRDAQEAMDLRLRTRYVQEATEAWQKWFENLALAPVSSLSDAVDRAQLFGSEASPLIALLNLLERHMPLPQNGQRSLWDRIKNRATQDWARLQYELGWKRTSRPALASTNPATAIGRNFALLQMYFTDGNGKAPARDRLLASVNGISDYMSKLNAAQQLDIKAPADSALTKLRAQSLRLPIPLRSLMLSMASSSENQVQAAYVQSLEFMLKMLPSHERCHRSALYPMDVRAAAEMPWGEFAEDFSAQGRVQQLWQTNSAEPWFNQELARADHPLGFMTDAQWLQRAVVLGKAWFPGNGQPLKLGLKPVGLSPSVRIVRLSIGDTQWSYAHGQIVESKIAWTPDAGVPKVEMEIIWLDGTSKKSSHLGAWSLLRWASQAHQTSMPDQSKLLLHFDLSPGYFQLLVSAESSRNPLDVSLYEGLCGAGKSLSKFNPVEPGQTLPMLLPAPKESAYHDDFVNAQWQLEAVPSLSVSSEDPGLLYLKSEQEIKIPVQQRSGHPRVTKDVCPLPEAAIASHDHGYFCQSSEN